MWWSKKPSNNRDWSPDQAILPFANIEGNIADIHNIRNCIYKTPTQYEVHYYDKKFNLEDLQGLWLGIDVLQIGMKGAAHILVSFEFKGDIYLTISAEIRKKRDDVFSPLLGMCNYFELMYVIGDENDLIKLRSNYQHDMVYLYPLQVPHTFIRDLFVDMLQRANILKEKPEFYNTLSNNCGQNLINHINKIAPGMLSGDMPSVFLENTDKFLYKQGLIDSTLPWKQLRPTYRINERAERYAVSPDFSRKIRSLEIT